jgi:endonuclease-3
MLSAQATDISVNKANEKLFKIANTPLSILNMGEAKLKTYIKTIGLYNTKASNIIATCKILIEQYNAQIPDNLEDLVKLPGVGRKTANVVLNTAFGRASMPVDTHIFRLANRIGLAASKTTLGIEQQLVTVIPAEYMQHAHHWLVLHGRYVCTARKPKCGSCIIFKWCQYKDKDRYAYSSN